jgi:hypothetical protein
VQKRLSQENENVATESLAFIVRSSKGAQSGLLKLLRGIAPDLPSLQFRTQQTDGSARPDMWGFDGSSTPRVFIENKFWAGLTENQPVEYLRLLAGKPDPAVLLVVVPESRLETVWQQFGHRLADAGLSRSLLNQLAGVSRAEAIDFGSALANKPILAVTSWAKLLSAIEAELTDEPHSRSDLFQLRALCDAADNYAPFSTTELTNQRTPSFILQLNSVVQRAVDLGVTEEVLRTKGLNPTHFWEGPGRYTRFANGSNIIAWFGTDFRLWRDRGSTPLWLVFSPDLGGRALEVRAVLEPWTQRNGIACSVESDGEFSVGIAVAAGAEPQEVSRRIVDRLKEVAAELSRLPEKPGVTP